MVDWPFRRIPLLRPRLDPGDSDSDRIAGRVACSGLSSGAIRRSGRLCAMASWATHSAVAIAPDGN